MKEEGKGRERGKRADGKELKGGGCGLRASALKSRIEFPGATHHLGRHMHGYRKNSQIIHTPVVNASTEGFPLQFCNGSGTHKNRQRPTMMALPNGGKSFTKAIVSKQYQRETDRQTVGIDITLSRCAVYVIAQPSSQWTRKPAPVTI